jgi:CDP-paratose 2-epimerase
MKRAAAGTSKTRSPKIGLVEWFRPGEYERVETVLSAARALGIQDLRTGISWADWYASEGAGWYAWLLPRLASELHLLPCVTHTPPSLGLVPKFSSPPVVPKTYADFIDVLITRFGDLFDWIELWNRPDNVHEWDLRLDPDWRIFTEMIGGAAYWIHNRGKKTVLSGLSPTNLDWLSLMHQRGVLAYIDAVGVQGFPGVTELPWNGWDQEIGSVRDHLTGLANKAQIWITQTGFSTWRGDERAQVHAFLEAVNAPAERMYWYGVQDNHPENSPVDCFHSDEREYHFGLKRADGRSKILFEIWSEGGLQAVRDSENARTGPRNGGRKKHVLITGGAGFIGTNLASRILANEHPVLVYDDLSRAGAGANVAWLKETYPKGLHVEVADIRDTQALRSAVRSADQVFHLAAQVAVTTSLIDPKNDFDVNLGGTLNLLEILRSLDHPPSILFTSTNKVYGGLSDLALQPSGKRYQPLDAALRTGISEMRPLDFHSPYGCSKGAADQYVLDYARTFEIPAVVFRMSCIYGTHQNGTEDQGWVAHFLIKALQQKPLTIFGDGMQVRDLLFVDDLVDAFLLAQSNIQTLSGQVFNVGGGLGNTISLLELLDIIENLHGEKPTVRTKEWRAGDQRYYVSDTRKFKVATGWAPTISVHHGVRRLYQWLLESRGIAAPTQVHNYGELNAVFTH